MTPHAIVVLRPDGKFDVTVDGVTQIASEEFIGGFLTRLMQSYDLNAANPKKPYTERQRMKRLYQDALEAGHRVRTVLDPPDEVLAQIKALGIEL